MSVEYGEIKNKKVSSENLIRSAIKQIEEDTGFHIIDIQLGDTYFLFKGSKDSICHFRVKEIPGFLFAFWNINRFSNIRLDLINGAELWSDVYKISSKTELVFFTQYEDYIDKFKPSCSGFVSGIYRQTYRDTEGKREIWRLGDVPEILQYMKKHPYKARYYSSISGENPSVICETSGLHCFIDAMRQNKDIKHYRKEKQKRFEKAKRKALKIARKLKTYSWSLEDYKNVIPRLHLNIRSKSVNEPGVLYEDLKKQDDKLLQYCEDNSKLFRDLNIQDWTVEEGQKNDKLKYGWSSRFNSPDIISGIIDTNMEKVKDKIESRKE